MASIYDHPDTYDLEHSGPAPDVDFFVRLVREHRPKRILEYACGDGRLTYPLAEAAAEWGGRVIGIDASEPMLASARKLPNPHGISWHLANVEHWRPDRPVDMILSACGSLSHLVETSAQIETWYQARAALVANGRFVIAEAAPDYGVMAEALRSPSRSTLQLDGDFHRGGDRLLRVRSASYHAQTQTMDVRYFYDRFEAKGAADRFVDDYRAHVYFPNELRLLFALTGFEIEREWGSYEGGELADRSRALIVCGRKI